MATSDEDATEARGPAAVHFRVRVQCLCRSCSKATYVDRDGEIQSGRLVYPSTRREHFRRDARAAIGDAESGQDDLGDMEEVKKFKDLVGQRNSRTKHQTTKQEDAQSLDVTQSVPFAETTPGDVESVDFEQRTSSIITLAFSLAAWLQLCCGLSREASTKVLKLIQIIISMVLELAKLFYTSMQPSNARYAALNMGMQYDIRTAISSLSVDPVLLRSVCCPKCFAQYPLDQCPDICPRRETRRSKPCGEMLWTTRHGSDGGPCRCPRRLYSTQSFESWLTWFLSRPGIEDLIEPSYSRRPTAGVMHDIQDSPAWQSLGTFTSTRGNLVFSYFIDWFNPLTNKIAGKKISAGAIMLFCLDLPPNLRYRPKNTFFAGVTPPPNEPTVTTITHVADPVIDQLADFFVGKVIPTHRYPSGQMTRTAVLPFIGDLLAIRKGAGYASHSAEPFCSFCDCGKSNIECLDPRAWRPRNGVEVRMAAGMWRDAQTKVARKELFSQTGVRWSALHKLFYRDPVRHTVLGVMHNWMEGILQHHARRKWGIGVESGLKNNDEEAVAPITDSDFMNIDTEDLSVELDQLLADSSQHDDRPSSHKRINREFDFRMDSSGEESGDDDFLEPDDDSDTDESSDGDNAQNSIPCVFNTSTLAKIRQCIADVVLPTWMDRPPTNLGDKSHGKLKADNWFVLFSVLLPMVLVELWSSKQQTSRERLLLENFYDLVTCTNIVASFSTSSASADIYRDHYIRYRTSLQKLFPGSGSVPNHHYAMHNGDLLKFWGPLMLVSEFPYEQHNGTLQKIKTNGHMYDLDYTMLRQICRRGRLTAKFQDAVRTGGPLAQAYAVLYPEIDFPQASESSRSYLTHLKAHSKGELLPTIIYDLILLYLNTTGTPVRHYTHLPHPRESVVLPRTALRQLRLKHKDLLFCEHSVHEGNSSIIYRLRGGGSRTGFIDAIWSQLVTSTSRIFIVVHPHEQLSEEDQRRNPFAMQSGFLNELVYARPSSHQEIIEPDSIISHAALRRRPPQTFGIADATMILHDLSRGRN